MAKRKRDARPEEKKGVLLREEEDSGNRPPEVFELRIKEALSEVLRADKAPEGGEAFGTDPGGRDLGTFRLVKGKGASGEGRSRGFEGAGVRAKDVDIVEVADNLRL